MIEVGGRGGSPTRRFDPAGPDPERNPHVDQDTPPAVPAEKVGPVAAVLLSHDQHGDNLDAAGRAVANQSC